MTDINEIQARINRDAEVADALQTLTSNPIVDPEALAVERAASRGDSERNEKATSKAGRADWISQTICCDYEGLALVSPSGEVGLLAYPEVLKKLGSGRAHVLLGNGFSLLVIPSSATRVSSRRRSKRD
jgi:hypothetical protein